MKELLPKLTAACLVLITLTLFYIAYRISQPNYVKTDDGQYLETRSGTIYEKRGNQLVPVQETTEERVMRQYPGGKHY